jgi:hypothetical protein
MWFQPISNLWKLSFISICIRSAGLIPKNISTYFWCILDRWWTANIYFANKVHWQEAGSNTGKGRYGAYILYEKSNDIWMSLGK